MKLVICCLTASVFCLALADVTNKVKESVAIATTKSSDSKSKRDASLLSGLYHGPSYKYLPPSMVSSLYNSYSGGVNGLRGAGHNSGGLSRGHNYRGSFSSGNHNSPAYYGFDYVPASSLSNGHGGFGFSSSNKHAGHGAAQHFGSGFKSGSVSGIGATFGNGDFSLNRPHSYANGYGHGSSGSSIPSTTGYTLQSHTLVGANADSSSGHHYSPSFTATGLNSGLDMEYQGDHIHNGAQEHVYVISEQPEAPSTSYLTPAKQHPLPSNSYGEPLPPERSSYNRKHNFQSLGVIETGPSYAAGHKGLGYYSFKANKPQVLHTSISGSGLRQPSYSTAPFKPSIFLGAKFEGSADNNSYDPTQQYLPPAGAESDSTGYNYALSFSPPTNYQEPNFHQSVEVQSTAGHEADYANLPPKSSEESAVSNGEYLPPSTSYGIPYAH